MNRRGGMRWLVMMTWVALANAGVWGQGQQAEPAGAKVQEVVIAVKDPLGAVVAGAQVRVAHLPEKMATDANGELALQLKPGAYAVFVSEPGFVDAKTEVEVRSAGDTQTLPIVLQVANLGGVMVTAADTLVLSLHPFHEDVHLKLAELKGMPRKTVTVHNTHSDADEKYEGVLLADLLTKYGAPLGKELHGVALAAYIVASGADGYAAVFSLAEVDPSFHPGDVLVADTMDGKALDARSGPLKLVVTEDKRPARGVRNLVWLELKIAK